MEWLKKGKPNVDNERHRSVKIDYSKKYAL